MKKKHGGKREGTGRKFKDPEKGKRIKVAITLNSDHHKQTAEHLTYNRSELIERALNLYFSALPF